MLSESEPLQSTEAAAFPDLAPPQYVDRTQQLLDHYANLTADLTRRNQELSTTVEFQTRVIRSLEQSKLVSYPTVSKDKATRISMFLKMMPADGEKLK